jgi:hypothetical protein
MHEKLAQVSFVVVVGASVTVVGVGVVVVGVVVGVKQQSFIEHPCGPLQTTDAGLSTDAYGTGQGKLAQLYTLVVGTGVVVMTTVVGRGMVVVQGVVVGGEVVVGIAQQP